MRYWVTPCGHKVTQVLSGRSNVFLLTNGRTNILIDTSPGFMWKTLQMKLERLRIEKLDLLILTHSHFDHAANAARIREKYKAQVVIHRSEAQYLAAGNNILPVGTNPFAEFITSLFAGKINSFARYQPCNHDIVVDETLDLSDSGFNAYLIHTPGHTQGSISIIVDNEIALVGDTMFGIFPWTAMPPFATDKRQLMKSWEKLLETLCKVFIPSHGASIKRSLVEKDLIKRKSYL